MKKANRNDVARAAGVSSATVSRVFNGKSSVAPELVRRVREAADALGYAPNREASSLRRGTSPHILVLDKANRFTGKSWFAYSYVWSESIRAIQMALRESPYDMLLEAAEGPEEALAVLEKGDFSGVILNFFKSPRVLAYLEERSLPHVLVNRHKAEEAACQVVLDEVSTGADCARRLRAAGCETPLFAYYKHGDDRYNRDRLEGFSRFYADFPVLSETDGEKVAARTVKELIPLLDQGRCDSLVLGQNIYLRDVVRLLKNAGHDPGRTVKIATFDMTPLIDGYADWIIATEPLFKKGFDRATRVVLEQIAAERKGIEYISIGGDG